MAKAFEKTKATDFTIEDRKVKEELSLLKKVDLQLDTEDNVGRDEISQRKLNEERIQSILDSITLAGGL